MGSSAIAYAVIAVVVVGGLVWLYTSIRRSGAAAQRVGDLTKTATIQAKQLEEANKPRDAEATKKSLEDGSF